MPEPDRLLRSFASLRKPEVARLVAFFERDDLLVKGTDRSPTASYRGGCLPYVLLSFALLVGWQGVGWGLTRPVSTGLAMALAVVASNLVIRTVIASRRSRDLLALEGGWHGLAWTKEMLGFRSLQTCCLVPWSEVVDVVLLDGEDISPLLRGSLWVHLSDKEKVLIEPRTKEGTFAARPLAEWKQDLDAARP